MTFLAICFLIYFAPAIVASSRQYPDAVAVWFTNFFFGWTGIGWLACLVWALSVPRLVRSYVPSHYLLLPNALGKPPGWNSANGLAAPVCEACFRPVPGTFDYCGFCGARARRCA